MALGESSYHDEPGTLGMLLNVVESAERAAGEADR